MRARFERQLEQLNSDLTMMGALCENAIACAVKAMLSNSDEMAKTVLEVSDEIDQKEKDIEALCLKLLLQQQPVARDLRIISSALKMITDMERIGDQAADIAEIITFGDFDAGESIHYVSEMASAVIKMVTESVDAFVKKDLNIAQAVIAYDDVVDDLFNKVKAEVVKMIANDAQCGEQAVDLLMIAKYLERIGDHATNIGEWVVFSITGDHIGGN